MQELELQIFNNAEFGDIRTMKKDNEPYFVAADIAKALGYRMASDMTRNIELEDMATLVVRTPGGAQRMTGINESGLYAAIFGSRLAAAKKFKHWVTSEVLPGIRENGGYLMVNEEMSDTEILARAVLLADKTIKAKEEIIQKQKAVLEEQAPKVLFADAVASSSSDILVGELAKIICQNGHEIGQNRLFAWLRDNGYLIKSGTDRNMPMQRYVEQGLFRIKERTVSNPDGTVRITKTTLVTGKGQVYFINKFMKGA